MKYEIDHSHSCYFGWNYDIYDTDTLTKTNISGSGEYESQKVTQMTEEEMREFAHKKYISLLENMRYEISQVQKLYDKKIKEIKDFEKAIDNRPKE
jgi:hypothetical protein